MTPRRRKSRRTRRAKQRYIKARKARLEALGWKFGDAGEFLELSPKDDRYSEDWWEAHGFKAGPTLGQQILDQMRDILGLERIPIKEGE